MIDDRDVWRAALLMARRYGDDVMLEAAERADQLLDEGDMAGAETWHRILNTIARLQAKAPAEGERFTDRLLGQLQTVTNDYSQTQPLITIVLRNLQLFFRNAPASEHLVRTSYPGPGFRLLQR